MKNYNKMLENTRLRFLSSLKKDDEIDESTFTVWKSELLKELPSFWEELEKK